MTFHAYRLSGHGMRGRTVESWYGIEAGSEEEAVAIVRRRWRFAAFVLENAEEDTPDDEVTS